MQPGLVAPKHGMSERYEAAYTLTGSQSQTCKVGVKAITTRFHWLRVELCISFAALWPLTPPCKFVTDCQ